MNFLAERPLQNLLFDSQRRKLKIVKRPLHVSENGWAHSDLFTHAIEINKSFGVSLKNSMISKDMTKNGGSRIMKKCDALFIVLRSSRTRYGVYH